MDKYINNSEGVELSTKWYLYKNILEFYNENIIWQQQAKETMAKVLSDCYQDFDKKKWPLAVLFFKWPTWVGKTEITKQTAKLLFGIPNWCLNIPCEQLKESHECTATLFWAPPWYVGYNDRPLLDPTNVYKGRETGRECDTLHKIAKKRDNMAVIVFDEIEKMHPIGIQSLLSIIDEGIVRLKNWNTVDLSNAIIIFTSNIWESAVNNMSSSIWFSKNQNEEYHKKLAEKDKYFNRTFSPEFIWRLDYILEFEQLDLWLTDKFIKKLQNDLIYETLVATWWNILVQYNKNIINYIKETIDTSKWNRNVHKIREQKIRYALGTVLKINKLWYYKDKHILDLDIDTNGELKCKLRRDDHDIFIDMDDNLEIQTLQKYPHNNDIPCDDDVDLFKDIEIEKVLLIKNLLRWLLNNSKK